MFVVFEGIDGSGKTTVSNRVAEKLRATGLSVEHLREGGKFTSNVTQAIREFGRDARNLDLTPHAEFMLYVARDVQLLDEMTRPALERAEVVIADRFLYSAYNLGHYGRGLPDDWVKPILAAAARGLEPDLVVLIDIDPNVARARRRVSKVLTQDKRPPSRKGLSGVGMQHRFRAGYREMASRDPDRWVLVDNDQDLEVTVARVFKLLADAYKGGAKAGIQAFRAETPVQAKVAKPLASPQEALQAFLAWVDNRMPREPHVAAYFLSGLYGPGIDERKLALVEKSPDSILSGTAGLNDPGSWALREAMAEKFPARVVRSISAFPPGHAKAQKYRDRFKDSHPLDTLSTYDGLDVPEAWALRDALYGTEPDYVVGTLGGIGTPRAWELRERWLAGRGALPFASYETSRIACKAVWGLDDDRAWEWRKEARDAAPISALGSLKLVTSDKAWKWLEKSVERAPKVVLDVIRRSTDPRAWKMREAMAGRCKEAIDSIQDLDTPEAWSLRDRYADLWPSTVLKSIGPWVTKPPGKALMERLLRQYPDNLSLMKHGAAIALGAHVPRDLGVD